MGKKRKRPGSGSKSGSRTKSARLDLESSAFCARCMEMTATPSGLKALRSSRGYRHHDRSELSFYSRSCLFCNGLFAQLCHDWKPDVPGQLYLFEKDINSGNSYYSYCYQKTIEAMIIQNIRDVSCRGNDSVVARATFDVSLNGAPYMNGVSGYGDDEDGFTPPTMRSASIFNRVRQCLQLCKTQHKSCSLQTSTLPKRVLDVRPRVDGTIKLHVTRKSEKHEYVALSYCWGGSQDLTATKNTLRYRVRGIQLTDIPQTILDAIWVTRVLGIRYLWVDSLCILQDDARDTATQIASMGDVYKGAALTIAAANAPSVSDGFLRLAHHSTLRVFYMKYHSQSRKASVYYDMRESIDPLEQRAWTFQESLLSRRLLIFADGKVQWRCQQPKFPPLVSGEIVERATSLIRLPSTVFGRPKVSIRTYGRQQIVLWEQIVEDYSKRELTFSHDRLPGIAGVASELAKVWNDTYLAGLWGSCLLNHLGWSPVAGVDADWWTLGYQAPTWSWASVRYGVKFTDINIPSAEILSCTVQPSVEGALFGQVASGELVIQAVDLGGSDSESTLRKKIRDKYPALADTSLADSLVKYPLLGYTSRREGIGLILVPHEDGVYRRKALWELEMTVGERAWCGKEAAKHIFQIF